ncbi:mitochondrial fission ELM1 family protein [Swaminathania salitolerans]|uniref:Nucleoside-diphosphate sugar epimerase n=1 Tax=Swaminathania salitolerans TaxID=182838 RepID=A0A511BMY4_9PROT|nr:mitochondrial fission ELM1 family protein [Swaminathania salitolerans]GBQ13867.1 hypothetical protein AA21291_1647 [Swaminathania salitolerans LMG 21291]GEL01710.1 hypothetical protein SSA02_08730 [Swaminathania salitolerans]
MSVAIIAEDFAGMRAQARGLVERAGLPWHFHPVRMTGMWRHVPTRFCPVPLAHTAGIALPAGTALLVSVGGTGGAIGAAMKRKTGLPLVQIQNPRMSARHFDLIVASVHDRMSGGRVVSCRTALHGITPDILRDARIKWSPRLRKPGKFLLSVLIGGTNGRFRFGVEEARDLARTLLGMASTAPVHFALTPSRRTDPAAMAVLETMLAGQDAWFWRGEGENPYQGLLACADAIAVTRDSVSMVSEAVATEAPVMIIDLPGRSRRIGAFIDGLAAEDRVRPLGAEWMLWPVSPLDDTGRAAEEMTRRLALPGGRDPQ